MKAEFKCYVCAAKINVRGTFALVSYQPDADRVFVFCMTCIQRADKKSARVIVTHEPP